MLTQMWKIEIFIPHYITEENNVNKLSLYLTLLLIILWVFTDSQWYSIIAIEVRIHWEPNGCVIAIVQKTVSIGIRLKK